MPVAIQPAARSSTWQSRLMTSSSPTIAANDASRGFEPAARSRVPPTKVMSTNPAPPIAEPARRRRAGMCRPASTRNNAASTAVSKRNTSTSPTSRSSAAEASESVERPTSRRPQVTAVVLSSEIDAETSTVAPKASASTRSRAISRRRGVAGCGARNTVRTESRMLPKSRIDENSSPTRATVPVQPKTEAFIRAPGSTTPAPDSSLMTPGTADWMKAISSSRTTSLPATTKPATLKPTQRAEKRAKSAW
jgi:hypothetical protein